VNESVHPGLGLPQATSESYFHEWGNTMETKVRVVGMRDRVAGQLLIEKVLASVETRGPQSPLSRAFGVPPVSTQQLPLHDGVIGEQQVGAMLATLPSGWHVFHSVPVGANESDIDHVVVGPGGVFAINAKNHIRRTVWVGEGSMTVDGSRRDYIHESQYEATRLSRAISAHLSEPVDASAVIAVVGAKIDIACNPHDVKVLDARGLVRWLRKLPPVLDASAVAHISSIVDDPATWRVTSETDTELLQARFSALNTRMHNATALRAMWIAAAAIGAFTSYFAWLHPTF
jgi:hypothetical protein